MADNSEIGQIRMPAFHRRNTRRFETGDSQRNLYEIVFDFKRGIIRIPSFQREFVWKDEKRKGFVNRLLEGKKPIGVICIYELNGDDARSVWLNDGLQRLSTCIELLENPVKYGFVDEEESKNLLKSYTFSVQHRTYDDHDEALQDYQDINQGTPLTPKEFYQGDITNIPNYENTWKPRIEQLNEMIKSAILRCGASMSKARKVEHQYLRHNLELFYRMAVSDKSANDYYLGNQINGKTPIEKHFRDLLVENTVKPENWDEIIKQLENTLNATSAEIQDIWNVPENRGLFPDAKLIRWLFDISIWRKKNNIPVDSWLDFVRKALFHEKGKSSIYEGRKYLISLGELSLLRRVCGVLDSKMFDHAPNRRTQKRPKNAKPGYDMSHIIPFSLAGEGPTTMEPASINRARGNRGIITD
jgi:hypothetical protein